MDLALLELKESKVDLGLFPAGLFVCVVEDKEHRDEAIKEMIEHLSKGRLDFHDIDTTIALGMDIFYVKEENREENKWHKMEQIVMTVDRNGLVAMARKFNPVGDEEEYLVRDTSHMEEYFGYKRSFDLKGYNIYLAVCYDIYGVKEIEKPKDSPDIILNCIHRFVRSGRGSDEVGFARKGLLGAAKKWDSIVFGSAHFLNKNISPRWPSAVMWDKELDDDYERYWKYGDNIISPVDTFKSGMEENDCQ